MSNLTTSITTVGVLSTPPRLAFDAAGRAFVDLVLECDPLDVGDPDALPTRQDVRVLGMQALNANASLGPGDRVLCCGRLTSYLHVEPSTGTRFRRQRILADVVGASLEAATAVLSPAPPEPGSGSSKVAMSAP